MWGAWAQADAVGRTAVLLLGVMSIATWYLILTSSLRVLRIRRHADRVSDAFWAASTLEQALVQARAIAPDSPYAAIAAAAANLGAGRTACARLSESLAASDHAKRVLRQAVQRASRRLDSGLSVLASVGATAPFVGLFGTVWGIYRALAGIGFSGQATIDQVAGPVGEALIMTALGIAVAVPAVLGYNFLLRANRLIAQDLDGFVHDLHAYLLRAPAAVNANAGRGAGE